MNITITEDHLQASAATVAEAAMSISSWGASWADVICFSLPLLMAGYNGGVFLNWGHPPNPKSDHSSNGLPFLWLGDPPLKHPSVGGPKIQIHPETSPCYWALGGFRIALAALLMLSRGAVQAVQGLVPNAGVHHVPRRTRKGPPRHSQKSMEIQNGRNPRPIKHWICFGAQTNSIMKRVNTG